MFIRFRTQGPLDFTNFKYVVAFNTGGNGQPPLSTSISSFLNWTFELIFANSGPSATYALQQIYQNAGSYNTVPIVIPFQLVTNFNPNSSGTGNEFTFTFNRNMINPLVTPGPGVTTGPTPSATSVPTTPAGISALWSMNFFSTDPAGNPLDSVGVNGAGDTAPPCCLVNTTQAFDQVVTKPIPPPVQVTGGNTSAQIIAIEVINTP